MPDLLDVGAQGVAELLVQRHVPRFEVQHQLVILGGVSAGIVCHCFVRSSAAAGSRSHASRGVARLQGRAQAPVAGDPRGVVGPFEAPQRPNAVDHLQPAADVAQRIGELVEADPAAVQAQPEMLVDRLVGPPPPRPQVEVHRAAGIERADHARAVSRARRPAAPRPAESRPPWPRTSRSGRKTDARPRPSDAPAGCRRRPSGRA